MDTEVAFLRQSVCLWSMEKLVGKLCTRGLRQGNPLAPMIFNLVANGLNHMINKCCQAGLIKGLGCRDSADLVVNLHYTYDTFIFEEAYATQAMILKRVLFLL